MSDADQQRQDSLVITTAVFTSLAFLVVLLRTIIRACVIRKAGWDDYIMIVAMIFSVGYFAEVLVGKANGIGHAMPTLSFDNMINLIKTTLAIEVTYYVTVSMIKISILCMYLRFVATRTLRLLCHGTIAFHAVFLVICLVGTLAQCQPLEKMWDLTGTLPGHCINTTAFFYFTSGFNIITDIWIIALPVRTLMKINRPLKEKIALLCVFGVGTFATIVSIIRLHTIYTYTLAKDPFQESIAVNLWSVIEINTGIICASVPALKPLFTPALLLAARTHGSASAPKHSDYEYHSQGRSGYIKSSKSVDQSSSQHSIGMGPIPSNSTKVTGGDKARGKDSDSTEDILKE